MEPMKPMEPMRPMEPMKFKESAPWWPEEFGAPNSAGSQNEVHYAYFGNARRLLLRNGDDIVIYDTGDHTIQGVSQASAAEYAKFITDRGVVSLSELKRL